MGTLKKPCTKIQLWDGFNFCTKTQLYTIFVQKHNFTQKWANIFCEFCTKIWKKSRIFLSFRNKKLKIVYLTPKRRQFFHFCIFGIFCTTPRFNLLFENTTNTSCQLCLYFLCLYLWEPWFIQQRERALETKRTEQLKHLKQ